MRKTERWEKIPTLLLTSIGFMDWSGNISYFRQILCCSLDVLSRFETHIQVHCDNSALNVCHLKATQDDRDQPEYHISLSLRSLTLFFSSSHTFPQQLQSC